eukprot:SAG31_NODE_18928_length_617_cov_3.942085_1_plen_91_part_10
MAGPMVVSFWTSVVDETSSELRGWPLCETYYHCGIYIIARPYTTRLKDGSVVAKWYVPGYVPEVPCTAVGTAVLSRTGYLVLCTRIYHSGI